MEASALFAVGVFRGVSMSSVFTISDLLSEEDWNQGYHDEEKLEYYGECCHGKSESRKV
jgi:purine-nucleoside phosphorylase